MVIQQAVLQPPHHGCKFELQASPGTGMGFIMPAARIRSQYGWSLHGHEHHALQDAQKDHEDQRIPKARVGADQCEPKGKNTIREEEYDDDDDDDSYYDDNFTFSLGDSTDFNFSSTNLQYEADNSSDQAFSGPFSPTMSSADELFHNGKIRPLFNITPMLNETTIITAHTPNHQQYDQKDSSHQPISTSFQAISVYEEPPQTATVKVCDSNQDDGVIDPEAIYYNDLYGDYGGLYGHGNGGYVPFPYIGGYNDDYTSSNGSYCGDQNQSSALMEEEGLQHYIYRQQQFIEEAIVRRSVAPEVATSNVIVSNYADSAPPLMMARVDVHNVEETHNAGPYGTLGGNLTLNYNGSYSALGVNPTLDYNDHYHNYEGVHVEMEGAQPSRSSETRTLRTELEEDGYHIHPNRSSETCRLRKDLEEDDHLKKATIDGHKKIKRGSLKELLRVEDRLTCTQALRRRKQQVMDMIKLRPIRRRPARVNHHDQSTISSSNSLINGHHHVHHERLYPKEVIASHHDATKRPSSSPPSSSSSYSSFAADRYASHPIGRRHPKSPAKARRLEVLNPPFPNQENFNRPHHIGMGGAHRVSSPHGHHYTAHRAHAKKMRKQTFLPYRPQLLACLIGHSP